MSIQDTRLGLLADLANQVARFERATVRGKDAVFRCVLFQVGKGLFLNAEDLRDRFNNEPRVSDSILEAFNRLIGACVPAGQVGVHLDVVPDILKSI